MATRPIFKQGDTVFTTCERKKLGLKANYSFGTILKIRRYKSGYRYYVCFMPTRIRPLVPVWTSNVWLNEADLLLKSEYAKYYLRRKINRFEADIERLQARIQGDKNQLLESKKEVEHLKNLLKKLQTE
jgi:hypothetical protein